MDIGSGQRIPEQCALFVALIWGLGWIPVRYLNQIGYEGIWGGNALNIATAMALLVYVGLVSGFTKTSLKSSVGAFIVGFGAASFFIAVSFTDVANTVLLFYLSPAWSTIIECLFLGRKWRWPSLVAIGSSNKRKLDPMPDKISIESRKHIKACLLYTSPSPRDS